MRSDLEAAARSWTTDRRGRRRLEVLQAVADTYVPSVRPPRAAPEMGGFWVRTASDLDTHLAVAGWIESRLRPVDRDGLCQLLDLLALTGFDRLPASVRERILLAKRPQDIRRGFAALRELSVSLFYGLTDERGTNPNWPVVGYPGPPQITRPPDRPRLRPYTPPPGQNEVALQADVVVVGSGSGGGVIAAQLAQAGQQVIVLEAGGHFEEHNFPEHELEGFQQLYWRGGFTPSDDGNMTIAAGGTLGGGSTINWTNCVPTPDRLRREWAEQAGLKDVDTPQFDEHLSAVKKRISATEDCSDLNGPNARMKEGAEALGWTWKRVLRNTDAASYDASSAGHMGFGDRSGSRQGGLNTYLPDAAAAGAQLLVRCKARKILTSGGKASGVVAVMQVGERSVNVTVTAPTVVVACGALETPALLLRSGIGGPAVGHNLYLHPSTGMSGIYPDDQRSWWGPPHSGIVTEFADITDGYGFLIEGLHYGAAYVGGTLPWHGGRSHKVLMSRASNMSTLIVLTRDRTGGRVTIDEDGEAVISYAVTDPLDAEHLRRGIAALAQIHQAAGATALIDVVSDRPLVWRQGQDLDAFTAKGQQVPLRLPHRIVGSAHQMGTARMGTDPVTSVADPEGQLHDTPGVWIGDTSAFPSASGVNPMLTCMALARRTAAAILAT